MISVGQEFWKGSTEWFWLGISHVVIGRLWLKLEWQGARETGSWLGTFALHVVSGPPHQVSPRELFGLIAWQPWGSWTI